MSTSNGTRVNPGLRSTKYSVVQSNGNWLPDTRILHRRLRPAVPVTISNLSLLINSREFKKRITINCDEDLLCVKAAVEIAYETSDLGAFDSLVTLDLVDRGVIFGGTTGVGLFMSWDELLSDIKWAIDSFTFANKSIKRFDTSGYNSIDGFGLFQDVPPIPPRFMHSIPDGTNFTGSKECVGHDSVKEYTKKASIRWSGNDWDHDATGFFCEPNPKGVNTTLAHLGVI